MKVFNPPFWSAVLATVLAGGILALGGFLLKTIGNPKQIINPLYFTMKLFKNCFWTGILQFFLVEAT